MRSLLLLLTHRVMFAGLAGTLLLASSFVDASADTLREKYQQIEAELQENVYGIPVYLHSNGDNGTMRGDVFGLISHPFSTVRDALGTPANWCEMIPKHLNIKACTYRHIDNECRLAIYTGRKFYEKADDVYLLDYNYQLGKREKDYFHIMLSAEDGPLDTGNYLITAEAIPVDEDSTFIHFSYSYEHGFITSLAMSGYFSTLGSGKIGFTVVGKNEEGDPVYVDGVRGVIERNAIRYYFVIQSFLDTLNLPPAERFEAHLEKWFALTEQHHTQLYEMEKEDYLAYKREERRDQLRLQQVINEVEPSSKGALPNNGGCRVNGFH